MGVQINGDTGNISATKADYSGNVTIGGTLTYEDVTNIDSVGLITAREGIEIGASPGVGASISVDGNAIFSGITTVGGNIKVGGDMTVQHSGLAVNLFESTDNHSRFRIKSGSSSSAQLEFADQDDADAGEIRYDHGNDRMTFHVGNNVERLRITSAGDIGIGNVNPTAGDLASGASFAIPKMMIQGPTSDAAHHLLRLNAGTDADYNAAILTLNHSNDRGIAIYGGRSTSNRSWGAIKSIDNIGRVTNAFEIIGDEGKGVERISFYTGDATSTTERLRITADGCLLVGKSTVPQNSGGPDNTSSGTAAEFVFGHVNVGVEIRSTNGASNQKYLGFKYGGGPTDNGGIRRDGTSNNVEFYNGSDRRIKTNIQDMDNTLSKICQMSLRKFDYKDGTGSGVGVIGQELINIFPEKVTKTDDGTGDTVPDGVEPWSVGNNYTYQILKAIQELKAENDSLKARIATLEGS